MKMKKNKRDKKIHKASAAAMKWGNGVRRCIHPKLDQVNKLLTSSEEAQIHASHQIKLAGTSTKQEEKFGPPSTSPPSPPTPPTSKMRNNNKEEVQHRIRTLKRIFHKDVALTNDVISRVKADTEHLKELRLRIEWVTTELKRMEESLEHNPSE